MDKSAHQRFARSEAAKADSAERLRARFATATPATKKPARRHEAVDWPRTLKAAALVLILVLAVVAGSGLFGGR
jgi:hypothetical protein